MASVLMFLCVASLTNTVAASATLMNSQLRPAAALKMHTFDSNLRSQMRSMMAEEDDEGDAVSTVLGRDSHDAVKQSGFLQTRQQGAKHREAPHMPAMDDYMEDSASGLSLALGPRWDAKELNENAEKSTKALLHHISGGKTMRSLKGMIGAMHALR